jgi:cyclase
MIFNRIIPSLLLKNSRLVKGENFKKFNDAGDPVKTIKAYCDQGADEIILSIIDNKKYEYQNLINEISKICNVPLCIYGNIQNIDDANFYFRNGADKIGINSFALEDISIFNTLSKIYGSQSICSTVNYFFQSKKIYNHKLNRSIDINIFDYLRDIQKSGVGEIKITSVSHEGKLLGPDKNLNEFIKIIKVPLIYEGGISKVS